MEVYGVIMEYLKEGKTGTIATIADKLGAAPREEGAKMFVGEDGRFFGTIGGGCMEAEVWQEARKVMKTKEAKIVHYRMDGREVEDGGMICGGNVDIFLEPLFERHKELFDAIQGLEKRGKKAIVITQFGENRFSKSLVDAYGGRWGDLVDETEIEAYGAYFSDKRPRILNDSVVVEPLRTASNLYVFGAGHISQYLARAAKMVDFNVVVIDDRADFSNKERFPEADKVVVADFVKVFDELEYAGDVYVVIVTRGHKHDAYVLEEALKRPSKYIGMIGSKRKVKIVYDFLKEKGFQDEILKTVHAPIGLKINSETPQEIAISIVAELIKARGE